MSKKRVHKNWTELVPTPFWFVMAWGSSFTKQQVIDFWFTEVEEKKDVALNGMYVGDDDNVEHYRLDEYLDVLCNNVDATRWLSFTTKEAAEKFAKKLKALKAIRKRKTENDGKALRDSEADRCWYIFLCTTLGRTSIGTECTRSFIHDWFLPTYTSYEAAQKAIEELEQEYRDYFA